MDIRTLVVDDERLAREELCFLLDRIDGVDVVSQAENGVEAIRLIKELQPDVVFLDVQMPGLTGFQVAREVLHHETPPQIVFVTAYDQYAIDAFDVNAIDYLLKPVESSRLAQAVDRARHRISGARAASTKGTAGGGIDQVVQMLADRLGRREQLAIKSGEKFLLVQADDIVHASLADNVITISTSTQSGTSNYRTLDELQAHLDPNVFWRVHRSHLVNVNKIKEIVPWFSRNYILKMKDAKASQIPVSRSQTKRLREYLRL